LEYSNDRDPSRITSHGVYPGESKQFPAKDLTKLCGLDITYDKESTKRTAVLGFAPKHLNQQFFERGLLHFTADTSDKEKLEAYESISAVLSITAKYPPVVSVHATDDQVVLVEQTEQLHSKLDEKGVPNKAYYPPSSDHGYDERLPVSFTLSVLQAFC